MQSLRDTSQQDRRVYVGNLSYDVKWHHLKDFMRQGMIPLIASPPRAFEIHLVSVTDFEYSWRGHLRRRAVASKWNVEGGRQRIDWLIFFRFPFGYLMDVGLTGWDRLSAGLVGMRVSLLLTCFTFKGFRTDGLDFRIVEYATRDQAQQAVNSLSNQNLMGRLVYVREVGLSTCLIYTSTERLLLQTLMILTIVLG